jgi:hypothetical protein
VDRGEAGVRRYHLQPNVPANVSLSPVPGFGPALPPPRPNCQVNFKHPYTGQMVTVPLQLPDDTPLIQYRFNAVIYNYGSDTVTVYFLREGGVDIVYNTGFLRAP